MVRKCSSLMLLWCFSFSCSECRLRRFRLLFPRNDLFEAGTSHAEDEKRTTQLCYRWLSNSRAHSPCTQTISLDGSQLLFSFTKLILLSSSTIAQVNALKSFLEIKFRGHPGSNQGPLGLQPNALPLSYIPLNIVNRQSTLSVRVYIELVRKRSCLVLLWFFSLSCSENQPRCFKFQVPRRELFRRRDLAYRK